MDIPDILNRYKWWLLLAVLLILNAFRYWPAKHAAAHAFEGGPPPGMDRGFPQPDAAMQARIDALPDDQKTAVEDWLKDGKDFSDSIQSLPEADRRQKMMEHMMQNPPPPGMPFPGSGGGPPGAGAPGGGGPGNGGPGNGGPGGPPGGPGGPGDGDIPHIPSPDVRRNMDQGLVNAMNSGRMP